MNPIIAGHAWGLFAGLLVLVAPVSAAGLELNSLEASDIGTPNVVGATVVEQGVATITASGQGIGFKTDQFHFAAAAEPGDFDVRVRVSALQQTDLWAKAGVMLRAGREAAAPFAAVVATPAGVGCLFQVRDASGGNAANQGFFPANQPNTWLRLRREGNTLTGYAGYDGQRWTLLGTKAITWGTTTNLLLGLAVTSHSTSATTAQFREVGAVTKAVLEPVRVANEPLGPCTRRTALVISEIMYHPAARPDGRNLEFVEIYNSQPYYEDLGGWQLRGDIDFTFPAGTTIPGCGFLVVAQVPGDVRAVYGLDGVLGPYTGKLNNAGGSLKLLGDRGAVLLDVTFKDSAPWPKLADGSGHSLVLVRPSYGEADPRAWAASRVIGGSPGMPEAVEFTPATGVCVNECQLPDAQGAGFVELYNASSREADLSGLRLGSSPDALPFLVPAGRKLAAGGFAQFTWAELGFRLNAAGDTLYVQSADGSRFLDAVRFSPQAPGTSAGRWPNGGETVRPLGLPTPGAANVRPKPAIVINEIHPSPASGDSGEEFIELYNATDAAVDMSYWQFTSGVRFVFAQGTTLSAGGYLVVARDAVRFQQLHPQLGVGQVMGDFAGKLRGGGEHLELSRPITVRNAAGENETVLTPVSDASYSGGGRWHPWSERGGSTLELTDPRADAGLSSNWADSNEAARNWITVEATGRLDNGPTGGFGPPGPGGGSVTPDSLHVILLGEGECLVDNVEVIGPDGTNRIANGTFEQGLAGWTCSGNHIRSSLETSEGYQSSQALHLRASGNGDTGANRIFVKLNKALTTNTVATLRARVKWVHGWPEVLLRLHGNYLEACGRLDAPTASGTPGGRNSRAVANAGPAFGEVSHFPVLPTVGEPVVVTARIDDPDGVASVALNYRIDPGTNVVSVPMRDDGTGGDAVADDGVFSARIPAPGTAGVVGFTIDAADGAAASASSHYPPGESSRECLVRFGDSVQSGAFGTYRLWVTQANFNLWKNRPVLSNEPVDNTFVYADSRVVYGAGGRFAGSPFHQQFANGPASDAHFVIDLPADDRVLGASAFNKLHAPGNGAFDDPTLQREQIVYWLARKSGLPWLHRRYFHFCVNGVKKKTLMEDTQVGSDDLVAEFWPQDADGQLYKLQPWFEFPDSTTLTAQTLDMSSSSFVSFSRVTTTSNELKLARYRWNWLVRGAETTANNYSNVLQFINTMADTSNTAYETNVEAQADVGEWLKFFAINHSAGNWDSVGYKNQQNTYAYRPTQGRWQLIIWDANIAFGNGMSDSASNLPLFTTQDPSLSRWFSKGEFKRRFRTAYYELINGPLQPELISPFLDAKYAAFQEHGVTADAPGPIKTWITAARKHIQSQIANDSAAFVVTNVTGAGVLMLSGTGPLDMVSLQINGTPVPVSWTTTKNWTAQYAPATNLNRLEVAALNGRQQPVAGAQATIALGPPGAVNLKVDNAEVVLEYPATRPGAYQLQATSALASQIWQSVAVKQVITGTVQFRLPAPTDASVFYRVLEP